MALVQPMDAATLLMATSGADAMKEIAMRIQISETVCQQQQLIKNDSAAEICTSFSSPRVRSVATVMQAMAMITMTITTTTRTWLVRVTTITGVFCSHC